MRTPIPAHFPITVTHGPWRTSGRFCLPDHDLYDLAKRHADVGAALQIIEDFVDWDSLDLIVDFSAGTHRPAPYIIAPSVADGHGTNALPVAYAAWLSKELGFPRCDTMYQYQGVKRDLKDGWFRFAHKTRLFGEIPADSDFIIVDDVCTLGGTLAETRAFIHQLGGRVIGTSCLASATGEHVQLALSHRTRYILRSKFGPDLNVFWREEFGYDTDCLTEPEAAYLLRHGTNVGRIRDAIHRARDQNNVSGT